MAELALRGGPARVRAAAGPRLRGGRAARAGRRGRRRRGRPARRRCRVDDEARPRRCSAAVAAAPLRARRVRADAADVHRPRQVARPPGSGAAALRARRSRLSVSSLVFVTQQVDPEHPALAATVPKLRALARRFDEVAVLAAAAVDGVLPENCRVRLYGSPSRAGRGRLYTRALREELRRRPDAVLVHMTPL